MVELLNFCLHTFEHLGRILTLAHENRAVDDVVLVVHSHDALALLIASANLSHVSNQHRHAGTFGDDDVANILNRAEEADAPDDELLFTLFDVTSAGVHVAAFERAEYLMERHTVGFHPHEVGCYLVLLDKAPAAHDVGHSWNELEVSFHNPVLDAAEFRGIVMVRLQIDAEDLADGTGKRR